MSEYNQIIKNGFTRYMLSAAGCLICT